MDSWSISNPTGHPVRLQALSGIHPQSHWSPCAFTGMHLQSHWDLYAFTGMHPQTNPRSRCPPQPFPPIPGSMFLYYISYKRQHGSACVLARCGVQSSGIFVALWPTCVVLSRYFSNPVVHIRTIETPRTPISRGGGWYECRFQASQNHEDFSCLVGLNSDLYRLCGSLHGLDTF